MADHKIMRAILLGPKVESRNAQNDNLASMMAMIDGPTMMVIYFIVFSICSGER
jgi:hypothetical protein